MQLRTLVRTFALAGLAACSLSARAEVRQGEHLEFIGIKPEKVFAKESTHVTVSAKWKTPLGPEDKLLLIEVDEQGRTKQIVGVLNDVGRWGDTMKGDGYYSKQFQVYEKKGDQKRQYTVVRTSGKELPETRADKDPAAHDPAEVVSVSVIRRPNMFEIMGSVWSKLTASKSKPAN